MNKTISRYLDRNILYPPLIDNPPQDTLGIIVVIPCFDEPDIVRSVEAIANCTPPQCKVEVIVSINAGVSATAEVKTRNQRGHEQLKALQATTPDWIDVYSILHNELPDKKAGVGLGRKIGMDEAVRRFVTAKNENGIVVCFDADSLCDPNYLNEIAAHFNNKKVESASIYYEHPISGLEYSDDIYDGIIQYELHLRYFIRQQKRLKLPYAFHTVGSSMACTIDAYCSVGGMNQRKAGEDFYFIHKLVKYGRHSELNSTRVIPSPRTSQRVPFGTGKAIGTMQENREKYYSTYQPRSFIELRKLADSVHEIYNKKSFDFLSSEALISFLAANKGKRELERILSNTSDFLSFEKKFWHWFDAFVLMKFLHFMRDTYNPDIPVLEAINLVENQPFASARDALIYYREMDRLS
ncbi:MAG: glycosyltransferase family 2 protein [Bacteroidota bacterium]